MRGSLAGYALVFLAGFGVGFMYHHIAAHITHHVDAADTPARLRSVEARLAQLEARTSSATSLAMLPAGAGGLPAGADAAAAAALPAPDAIASAEASSAHRVRKRRRSIIKGAPSLDGCPAGRKPYHVVLTAQDSTYQAWQTRIMLHHLRRIQRSNPCTEITGFTRLLSSADGRRDALADEIPTVTARALEGGSACEHTTSNSCDMGFPVMNRPHAVTQLLAK